MQPKRHPPVDYRLSPDGIEWGAAMTMERPADNSWLARRAANAATVAAEGEEHIRRQRAMIEQLQRDGRDTTRARRLLETMLATRSIYEQNRDRLESQMKAASVGVCDAPGSNA
jgi:hypothetical protein